MIEVKTRMPEPKGELGEPCPKCNVPTVQGPISCPDGKPGCCVLHFGYRCPKCGSVYVEDLSEASPKASNLSKYFDNHQTNHSWICTPRRDFRIVLYAYDDELDSVDKFSVYVTQRLGMNKWERVEIEVLDRYKIKEYSRYGHSYGDVPAEVVESLVVKLSNGEKV